MSAESRKAEFLRRKDTYADLMEEVREYIGMSPEERDRVNYKVCRAALLMLRDHSDPERVICREDPLPASSVAHWRRLMEKYRSERA